MNPFEKFKVKHLSASSLNCWREQPGLWCLRYLMKVRDEMGAAVWRGNAVEGALDHFLRHRDPEAALTVARDNFEANAQGEVSEQIDKERDALAGYVEQACEAMKDTTLSVLMTQAKIELWLDDVPVPLIGYVDFVMDDGSLFDLKTTARIPSEPRPDHARQVAIYMEAREAPGSLLYVSGKRSTSYPVENHNDALAGLRRDALALMGFLNRHGTPDEAARSLPMNVDHFMYGEETRAKAMELFA